MRCDAIEGYYLQYKDSGRPVEVLDRVTYAFQSADRTCLVRNANHLSILLKTDRYRVVGVELTNGTAPDPASSAGVEEEEESTVTSKPRGRPRKGR